MIELLGTIFMVACITGIVVLGVAAICACILSSQLSQDEELQRLWEQSYSRLLWLRRGSSANRD